MARYPQARTRFRHLGWLWAVAGALVAAYGVHAAALPLERVSVSSTGAPGKDSSSGGIVSADGRFVVFSSFVRRFVPGDTNGTGDVFVRDRRQGLTQCVSVDPAGQPANGFSAGTALSADGRYVVFVSDADNLVSGDTNGVADVFVRDLQSGVTECVSRNGEGVEGNASSGGGAISADGRYVAFESTASNLVPDDTNGTSDVFVRDRLLGTTERVSVATDGTQGEGHGSSGPSLSADGRYVAFASAARNLVPDDTNEAVDVFVRDRELGVTERVSVDAHGVQGTGGRSFLASLSADGRCVAFVSSAFPEDGRPHPQQVFLRDRKLGTTECVSLTAAGTPANGDCGVDDHPPALSADGRCVAFESLATNLVSGDTNRRSDIFVRDRGFSATVRVSVAGGGTQANGPCNAPSLSADGGCVVFTSAAGNLVPGDVNRVTDVFLAANPLAGAHGTLSVAHTLNFGVVPRPAAGRLTLVLQNTHRRQPLDVFVGSPGSPFTVAGGGYHRIPPRHSLDVTLTFLPSAAGPALGSLPLRTSDGLQPVVDVLLTGTGQ